MRITIRRDTDLRDRAVDFVNAAELTEADLDNSAAQVFYAMQEAQDNSQDTISPDPVGNWDIHDRNIVNLRAGDKPHHGVNKAQLDKKDAEWNQLDQSMKESIETMGNQIIEAKEHVNMAGLKSSEAQAQADRAYTQADRAEDEADRAQIAQNATGHLRDEVQTQKELMENYNNEIRGMYGEIEASISDAEGYKVSVIEAASQIQDNTETVQRDREAVTNLRADVENRQDKVVEKHIAVQTLHDATKQYRDEAQLIAGKAENYVVDYGVWNPKLGLPPKPATSARWKASQGGTVEGLGVFRAGDWLDYSVKTDKFYREGNVLSVNGRSGDLTLNHEDVGAFSRAEANNRFLFKDEKAVDSKKADHATEADNAKSADDSLNLNGRSDHYHPGNKPHASDVGALPSNGKAVDASKLNGRSDYYHPENKPSASDIDAYSKSQTYSKAEADEKFTVGYATADKPGLIRVQIVGDTLEIFTS